MTYQAYEISVASGEPILLFDFYIGLTHWRYTTADRPIVYGSNTYTPAAIDASNIVQGAEIRLKTVKVVAPSDLLIVQRLQQYPPSGDLMLTVYEYHYTDPDVQTVVAFIGRVMGQTQKQTTVDLAIEPAYTGVQTMGLRRRWQINCPHVLYGGACSLSPTPYRTTGVLTAVSGFSITASGFVPPTGLSFRGGYVEWDSGAGYNERRTIDQVSGTTLTLSYGSPDLVVGKTVYAYPGCDHTGATCSAFGNILNYGGALNIPTKNPMSGNPVY